MSEARAVALLDLHARADQFQDDASLGALAAELQKAGHRVALVRSVLADEKAGLAAWHERLGRFLREGDFDLAVLARVWEESTIAVIREALGEGGRVVRLTSGVAAALDPKLDHVLDMAGLGRLLAGEDDPSPAAWRPVRPAELRRRAAGAPNRLVVLAPATLPGESEERSPLRPTLSGPASGCPFLLDATKSPIFADLGADPSKVQMKGCTFCLDNTGSYAVPSEEAVIGAWLAQLRRIRAESPGVREILLTDERPHPYLPALFRALIDEPALGSIELLFKSRVDWLLEFADGPLAEAAALAEQSKSVLHLYLIGFESFDAFHLELFNKGCTVRDNVRAIDKVRELGARFPRSFEFLRYRAHGIVLFTPWTTPESLLENARMMREVRFHELRSEAIRTRLRLYPRVPLHALAARDGLLVEAFEAGRPDRAVEQGYDASVPWRFKDARTEAIFRAATDFARVERSMSEADVLEIATRLVMRYPGLARVPELAWLPLRQALRAWGGAGPAALDGLDAAMLSFDPEVDLVALGKKRACLKEAVVVAEAEELVRAYQAMGLSSAIVELHGFVEGADAHARGEQYAIVAVAMDQASLDAVLEAQRAHGSVKGSAAVRVMGELMGYPRCCVSSFVEQRTRGDNLDNERLTFRRAPHEALHPLLHRVGGVRFLSHHPCSPACAGSIAVGEAILAALADVDAQAASKALEKLSRPVLFLDYQRRIELRGGWEGARFVVESAIVLDEARHLGFDAAGIAQIELSRDGARMRMRDGSLREVHAPSPLLTTPGAPLHPAALEAIGGPLADEPERARAGAPALPASLRPGVRVHDYRILSLNARGEAREIVLASATHRFTVRVRAHDPSRPGTLRRGDLALDLDRPEELPTPARLALGLLVRALPGGSVSAPEEPAKGPAGPEVSPSARGE
jgi:hypothetical protein